jgi:hypothetical protein
MLLRRRRKELLDPGTGQVPLGYVGGLLKNIESLGFTCSPPLIERLLTQSEAELLAIYGMLTRELRRMVGADRLWQPMYPNFPEQVMDALEAELYLNALMHYLGDWMGLRVMPQYVKEERPPLGDQPLGDQNDLRQLDLKVIGLGDDDELFDICRRLVGSKTSISAADRGDVAWLVQACADHIERLVPVDIPHKENLSFITTLLLALDEGHLGKADVVLTRYFKTATDILRLATSMSDGDISLARNTRYRSFKRSERRLLLSLLDRCNDPREDMQRHAKRWIRLGERNSATAASSSRRASTASTRELKPRCERSFPRATSPRSSPSPTSCRRSPMSCASAWRPSAGPRCSSALPSGSRWARSISTRRYRAIWCLFRSVRPARPCARWCADRNYLCPSATPSASSSGGAKARSTASPPAGWILIYPR